MTITSPNEIAIIQFGKSHTGKTPYYTIKDSENNVVIARDNTGVVELGYGIYGVDLENIQLPDVLKGIIFWDDGETPIGRTGADDINIGIGSSNTFGGVGS